MSKSNWRKDYPNLNSSVNSNNKMELKWRMYNKFGKNKVIFDQETGLYLDLDGKFKKFQNLSIEGKKAWENQYRYNINENEQER